MAKSFEELRAIEDELKKMKPKERKTFLTELELDRFEQAWIEALKTK